MSAGAPLVELDHLVKHFPVRTGLGPARAKVHAVDDVSFAIARGETLGLVGESGCGKSTLARCIVRLMEPTGGALRYDGRDITHLGTRALRPLRRHMQMVFQDPMASLNPRKTIGQIVGDGLAIHGIGTPAERRRKVAELVERVGLPPDMIDRLAADLSGGQRQRIGIARALALGPEFIVADEPVSALDVSVQADILNLLKDLQDEFGITYLFISHDLGVIRQVSDRIGVMYLGRLVELSPAEAFYQRPLHRYSQALLQAIAVPDPERATRRRAPLTGDVPSPIAPPAGCRFHPRCPFATDICGRQEPALRDMGNGRLAACHHPNEADRAG
ncbi:MAG: ATP-binding cassette domain-containing protein [Bauldia sp.]|nr:ATP-binding cassette domain-containing protein [Bauldia sp.]